MRKVRLFVKFSCLALLFLAVSASESSASKSAQGVRKLWRRKKLIPLTKTVQQQSQLHHSSPSLEKNVPSSRSEAEVSQIAASSSPEPVGRKIAFQTKGMRRRLRKKRPSKKQQTPAVTRLPPTPFEPPTQQTTDRFVPQESEGVISVVSPVGERRTSGLNSGKVVQAVRRRKIVPVPTTPTPPLVVDVSDSSSGALNRTEEEKRFLSLFTIVTFKNDLCTSTSGNNGTCYSSSDCSKLGGVASGTCASGFGVCCLFTKTCGESTDNNGTYFQNEGYPSTFNQVGSCQLTVNKCSTDVCQLRLDFDNFVLSQPEGTDHVCQADQFVVSGGAPISSICGTNTGQHMYIDMGLATNAPITLTVVTSGASFSRSFSIKVTQIECSSLMKASDGCLQFFTGVSGVMHSFNYNNAAGLMISKTDYTVCVRTERNFCGIQYTACEDTVNSIAMSFSVTGSGAAGAAGSVVGDSCITDWITIPCATNTNSPTAQSGTPTVCVDRICGMVFNSVTQPSGTASVPVNSYVRPFTINVHTDATEGTSPTAESANRGFCLNYVQQPCNAPTG